MKVMLMMALTVDGKIGKDASHFPDWTEQADKKLFMKTTKEAGAIIMGSKTFDTLGKPLPGRKHVVLTRNKNRRSDWKEVVFTQEHPRDILLSLKNEGYAAAVIAGGAQINHLFAKENLIDEVIVTFSPKIFGAGLSLFSNAIDMDLTLIESHPIGKNTLYARYGVVAVKRS
jgi:dihydrofolate reductase